MYKKRNRNEERKRKREKVEVAETQSGGVWMGTRMNHLKGDSMNHK